MPSFSCPAQGRAHRRLGRVEVGQGVWMKSWAAGPEVVRTRGEEPRAVQGELGAEGQWEVVVERG